MLYITHPIIDTEADVLLVPIRLDGKVPTGTLQWGVVERWGASYEMDFAEELGADRIKAGEPGIYSGTGGPVIVNFPYMETDGEELQLSDIVTQFKEVVTYMQYFQNCYTIAVPPIGKNYTWENIETICRKLEELNPGMMEFWLYPENEEWEGEDETKTPVHEEEMEVLTGVPLD